LVERAGGDVPDSFSGRSLFADSDRTDNWAVFSEADITPSYNGSVRTDRWRYIRDDTIDEELLFDHESDPDEQRDVLAEYPEVGGRLADRLDAHVTTEGRSVGSQRDVTQKNIEDKEVQDRLEDLGYLG
jgi:hypothetical protein